MKTGTSERQSVSRISSRGQEQRGYLASIGVSAARRYAGMAWLFGGVFVIGLHSAALSQDQDKSKAEKPKKPALYDPKADARTQIDAATAQAKRQNARVLVMFGFEG